MTPKHLETIGRLLHGHNWHRPLARDLKIDRRRFLRMSQGLEHIPDGLRGELAVLCAAEAEKLQEASIALGRKVTP